MAAQTSWQFIQEVGLNTNPETGQKEAVNVSFQFVQNGRVVQLNVPLLTIVPIPYIAIHDIDINFKANISASSSNVSEQSTSSSTDAALEASGGLRFGPFHMSAKMNASYSSKKDSRASVEYTMDVAVKAGQESMPAGLAKVLELLGSSLDVCDPEGTLEVSARDLTLKDGKAQLIATYKNSKGIFEPKAISVDGGASSTVSDNSVIIDFTSANKYTLKAGGKTLTVNVSAEAPSAKTAEK